MLLENNEILYEDKYCKVTKDYIEIYWYYFPTPVTKKLKITDIETVILKDDLKWWQKKIWGIGGSCVWWPCDKGRILKKNGIWIKVRNKTLMLGITPKD